MTTDSDLCRRRSCSAVLSLARTVRTMRQHDDLPRLRAAAQDRCRNELLTLLGETDLVILLQNGAVCCLGQSVLPYGPTDVPFGLLAESGIGELTLAQGTSAGTLDRMLTLFAAARATAGADVDLAAELHRANLAGLHLCVPEQNPVPRRSTGQRIDWWLLPEPQPTLETQRLVERDLATNLPFVNGRQLLADLDATGSQTAPTAGRVLGGLMQAMLQAGDAAGAAWMLEQAEHHPGVGADQVLALRGLAVCSFESDWLGAQLEHGERTQGLVTLGLQLGDESFEKLTAAAATAGVPLPDWVTSMLPPGE